MPTQRRSQVKQIEESSKAGETENRHHLGGASSERRLFQVVGPTTEKERLGIGAERVNEAKNRQGQRTAVYGGLHKKRKGGTDCADRTYTSTR